MPGQLSMWKRLLSLQPKGPAQDDKPLLSQSGGKLIAVLALVGAALLVIGKGTNGPQAPTMTDLAAPAANVSTEVTVAPTDSAEALAHDLRQILRAIADVGDVQVYVTMESGPQIDVAEEVTRQESLSGGDTSAKTSREWRETRRPVTLRDDAARTERPLITVQKEPVVRGVVVVAAGAHSVRVKREISLAVQTALGLPAHRVSVFAMKPL